MQMALSLIFGEEIVVLIKIVLFPVITPPWRQMFREATCRRIVSWPLTPGVMANFVILMGCGINLETCLGKYFKKSFLPLHLVGECILPVMAATATTTTRLCHWNSGYSVFQF